MREYIQVTWLGYNQIDPFIFIRDFDVFFTRHEKTSTSTSITNLKSDSRYKALEAKSDQLPPEVNLPNPLKIWIQLYKLIAQNLIWQMRKELFSFLISLWKKSIHSIFQC